MTGFVYFNSRLKCYSIKFPGLSVVHSDRFVCLGARFTVGVSGRNRVLRERRKNVHALIRGDVSTSLPDRYVRRVRVRYNPYECGYFKTEAGDPVLCHSAVIGTPDGVFLVEINEGPTP